MTPLPPPIWDKNRRDALNAFEKAVGRQASNEELDIIAEKNIRSGSSVFCMFKFLNMWFVFLSVQGAEYGRNAGKLTATGGGLHDVNEDDDQARAAAVRELGEEVVNARGQAIIKPNPNRLHKEFQSVDISMLLPGHDHPEFDIVVARNFSVVLGFWDTVRMLLHRTRLIAEPHYAFYAYEHTFATVGNEVSGFKVTSLNRALKPKLFDRLRHAHEKTGLQNIAQRLHAA